MTKIKALVCIALVVAMSGTDKTYAEQVLGKIEVTEVVDKPLSSGIRGASVFAYFNKSDTLTAVANKRLGELGYTIAPTKDEADVVVRIYGTLTVSRAGGEPLRASFAKLAEADKEPVPSDDPQANSLATMGVVAATVGTPVAGLASWLAQKTGLASSVNKMITGDPRGVCAGSGCNDTFRHQTQIWVSVIPSDKSRSDLSANSRSEAVAYFDQVQSSVMVADAIERELSRFSKLQVNP